MLRLFPEAEGVIGIENNKPDAIKTMESEISKQGSNKICHYCRGKVPPGSGKDADQGAVTKQEYVMTALPADVGCII